MPVCGARRVQPGAGPVFRLTLFDNPSGRTGLGEGRKLATATVTGTPSPKTVFEWTSEVVALDGSGATNGKVILQLDLLEGGYAAFDNLRIVASDREGDLLGDDREAAPPPLGRAYRGG